MASGRLASLATSVVAGALIWALSPAISGHREPWDSTGPYYILSLLGAGLLLGFVRSQDVWLHPVGIFVGQLAYELAFLPWGPLMVVGVVFMAAYSLLSLLGAVVGAGARRVLAPPSSR